MKAKILLVDDDLAPTHYYIRALSEADYSVEHKRNPDDALTYLDQHGAGVQLIILDVMMPMGNALAAEKTDEGMTTGFALLKKIRAKWPDLPILVLSNLSTPEFGANPATLGKKVECAMKIETDPFELVEKVSLLLDPKSK